MTKEEFLGWKSSIATQEVFHYLKEVVHDLESTLAREAGINDKTDRFKAGIITGLEAVLTLEWPDEEEDENA